MDNVEAKERFYAKHGAWATTPEGAICFQDGAVDSEPDSNWSRMLEPSQDEFERAKVQEQYWRIVAKAARDQFEHFQSYLRGSGRRLDLWATFHTDKQKIAHLKLLRTTAAREQAKWTKAKKVLNDATPYWLKEQEAAEIEEQTKQQEFLNEVDSIQL